MAAHTLDGNTTHAARRARAHRAVRIVWVTIAIAGALLVPAGAVAGSCPVTGAGVNDYLRPSPSPGTPGGQLFAIGGVVTVEYCGAESDFENRSFLGLDSTNALLDDAVTAPGTIVTVGSFDAGTELIFRDLVQGAGRAASFFSGLAQNNGDGVAHASVLGLGSGLSLIGFEDILFVVTGVSTAALPTPAPAALLLFVSGLVTLGATVRATRAARLAQRPPGPRGSESAR